MPYFDYSQYNYTTSPQTSPFIGGVYVGAIKNSITETSTVFGFRDFLLHKNIINTNGKAYYNLSTTQNGGPKIGEPVLDTSVNNNVNKKPVDAPITVSGIQYKNLNNIINNKFKNFDANTIDQLVDIPKIPNPPIPIFGPTDFKIGAQSYPEKPNELIDNYGLLAKTTYKKYKEDATLKNLYDVTSQQIDMSDYIDDPYTTTKYFEVNSNVVKSEGYLTQFGALNQGDGGGASVSNIIGSIGGLGLSSNNGKTGLATNYDIRSSLVGRILGATGTIKDTNIGKIGGQQLAFALANNAAFNVQEEILGKLNIKDNVLSLIKGEGLVGFRPNYQITVPSSGFGKLLGKTASILGFTLPKSFIEADGSIFANENGNTENIKRANALLKHTGKGQFVSLIKNAKASLEGTNDGDSTSDEELTPFRSGYSPSYAVGDKQSEINGDNIYAYSNGKGHLTNPLAYSKDINGKASVIPDLSFIRNSGFESFQGEYPDGSYGNNIKFVTKSWTSTNDGTVNASIDNQSNFYSPIEKKNLLNKTQKLFDSLNMRTIISSKGILNEDASQIQTTNAGGISKGSAVLKGNLFTDGGVYNGKSDKAENTYARAWTTFDRYDKVSKLIRHSGLYDQPNVPYRNKIEGSVLDDNGFVKITPYVNVVEDPKKFMFSIENLAWNDSYFNLLPCERGTGDLLTGKKGRIMWFPPYDIQFNESSSVEWDSNKFIGRGESVYTYSNTERSGTLTFKVVVDHPTYINAFSGNRGGNNNSPDDNYVASFFAGEIDPSLSFSNKLTSYELDEVLTTYTPSDSIVTTSEAQKPKDTFTLYFPNDVYTYYPDYENGICPLPKVWKPSPDENIGCGLGYVAGQVTSIKNYNDKTNFGLNSKYSFNRSVNLSFMTLVDDIALYLKNNVAIIVKVKGTASEPGKNTANDKLASNRADTVIGILKTALNAISVENVDKKVKKIDNVVEANSPNCTAKDKDQDGKDCKLNRKAIIEFDIDYDLFPSKNGFTGTTITTPIKTVNPFYGECTFFEKLNQKDYFVFDKFRDKIKYFHPAFHSTTPEGLNSRLTFLLQCTRQGPTLEQQGANNLAFGRPPICILRIGDFYNTKIVIDSVSFDYEPLVWDLNPEGIGVQPMIANVNMSFKFIGGSTLLGPINKLQNALSFNYFANTHVYDVRADYLSKVKNPAAKKNKQPTSDYEIINAAMDTITYNNGEDDILIKGDLNKAITTERGVSRTTTSIINQTAASDDATNGKQEGETLEPEYIIDNFVATFDSKLGDYFVTYVKWDVIDTATKQIVNLRTNPFIINTYIYTIPVTTIIKTESPDDFNKDKFLADPLKYRYTNIGPTEVALTTNVKVGYKLVINDINSSEIYEEEITQANFINHTEPNFQWLIPIKKDKKSTDKGLFDSLGKETYVISLVRTMKDNECSSTDTTGNSIYEIIKKQNIKLK
jgi:hypothetical protein